MMRPDNDERTVCRLVRGDGTMWAVTGLRQAEGELAVDALRFDLRSVDDGEPSAGTPSLRRLEGERLTRGDLIQWIGEDGEVVWSMTLPVRPARA